MGFEVPDEIVTVNVGDGPYTGAQATLNGLTAGELVDLTALTSGDLAGQADELFTMFAKNLRSWNLERNEVPIPTDLDNVRALSWGLFETLLDGWMDGIGGIDRPLESRSNGGGQPAAAPIPMEPLSANP